MQIYFYTRTGRSKKVAEELAERHATQALQISDETDWSGVKNFMRGGYMSVKKQKLPATYPPVNNSEPIILVFPIWAGSFPPAVRTFLNEVGARGNITLVPTSLSSKLSDREGFAGIIELIGKEISTPENL